MVAPIRMKLLLDTDAFCKLAVSNLLRDAVGLLGMELEECGRLPALPHMLGRGSLRRRYGPAEADAMIQTARLLRGIPRPSAAWLDPLAPVQAIDPGEALIFAAAAESEALVVSGDKRALGGLKNIGDFRDALAGRIVVLEALLMSLCRHMGRDLVRQRVRPLLDLDRVIRICFSSEGSGPEACLLSYFEDLQRVVSPLELWYPDSGAA